MPTTAFRPDKGGVELKTVLLSYYPELIYVEILTRFYSKPHFSNRFAINPLTIIILITYLRSVVWAGLCQVEGLVNVRLFR